MRRMGKKVLLVTMALSVLAYATPAPVQAGPAARAAGPTPPVPAARVAADGPEAVLAVRGDEEGNYSRREAEAKSLEEFRGGWHGVIIAVAIIAAVVFLVVFLMDGVHYHYYGCGHEWHCH